MSTQAEREAAARAWWHSCSWIHLEALHRVCTVSTTRLIVSDGRLAERWPEWVSDWTRWCRRDEAKDAHATAKAAALAECKANTDDAVRGTCPTCGGAFAGRDDEGDHIGCGCYDDEAPQTLAAPTIDQMRAALEAAGYEVKAPKVGGYDSATAALAYLLAYDALTEGDWERSEGVMESGITTTRNEIARLRAFGVVPAVLK